MSRIASIPALGGRRGPLLVLCAAAMLLALALGIEPGTSTSSRVGDEGAGGRTVGSPSDPSTSARVDPASGGETSIAREVLPDGGGTTMSTVDGADTMPAPADGASAALDSTSPASPLRAPSLEARIVRSASLELRVTRQGRFEDVWGDAQAAASSNGGYVVASSRSGAGAGPRVASITLSVPSRRFDAAVSRLREVDGVSIRRLDVASQDVSQEFVDVRSRLRHDRAVEGRLLALLAQTKGVSEVLAVQSRLDVVQEQIEVSRGRLEYLSTMTSMSSIEVTISERGARSGNRDREASTLAAAWGDAGDRLVRNVAAAIVWLGGALPALVLVAVVAAFGRTIVRRRGLGRGAAAASDDVRRGEG